MALLLFCGLRNRICIYTRSLCYFPNPEMLTSYPLEHKQNTFSLSRVFFFFPLLGFCWVFFFFWLCHMSCMIWAPWPGIQPMSAAGEAWSPSHWTTREFPFLVFLFYLNFIYLFLFLAELGLRCCTWAFSSCCEQGLLCSYSVWTSYCSGFSCGAQAPGMQASIVLQLAGSRAQAQ